jgi:hypothetical protein
MKLAAAVIAIAACGGSTAIPQAPAPAIEVPIAPAIVVPIAAEAEYVALDPHDPRFDHACDELAFLVAHGGSATTDIATSVLRMHGIVVPPNTVITGAVGESLDAKFGEDFYRPNAMVGKGTFEQTAVEVLILRPNIRIGPVPRSAETGVELSVVLDSGLRDPHVTVADSYETVQPEVTSADDVLHVTVPCGAQPSERFITIEATDPRRATTPLLIFPIYCKLKPPTTLAAEPVANLAGFKDLDGRLIQILARERASSGLRPLRRDARVEAAALAYARDRAQNRKTDRRIVMRDAGLIAPAMSWSTFHVDSLESGVNRILNSAEELDKLRDPDRTDVGVGAKRDADGWWISIVYITIPAAIDTAAAATRIENAIAISQLRLHEKVVVDPYADVIATEYAQGLAVGWSPEDLHDRAFGAMAMRNHIGCEIAIDRRVELARFDVSKLINKHDFDHVGIGIAQSSRNGPLAGTIWIVACFYRMIDPGQPATRSMR